MGSSILFSHKPVNLLLRKRSENLDISLGIGIRNIQPELVEFVWRSVTTVEPDIPRLCLAELTSVGLRNQRASEGKNLATVRAADQFGTRSDVPPLVGAAHLDFTVLMFVKIQEIVALKQLIGKFRE